MSQPPSAPPSPERSGEPLSSREVPPTARLKGSPGGTTTDHVPETFGRYRILKILGEGGMGAVYLAQDTQLARKVALKVPRFGANAGPQILERFFREARAAAAFDHPNLCPVYDAGTINGVHYLTMPFIEGRPLADCVKPDKPLQQQQAAEVVRKIALAVAEAHKRGVVHRDLKPANVMINQRGEPVVMDFGLARMDTGEAARLTGAGAILGTPSYMAPEQVKGEQEQVDPLTDVYALGVILYELLTGRRPFEGPTTSVLARILTEPPRPVASLRPDVDPALAAVCHKALAKEPGERFASMEDFAKALTVQLNTAAAPGGHPSGLHTAPLPFPAGNEPSATAPHSYRLPPRLTKWHLAGAAGMALLLGVVIWAGVRSRLSGKETQSPETPAVVMPPPPGLFTWPVKALREGRIPAPDMSQAKRLFHDDFDDPKSVWRKEKDYRDFDIANGRYHMRMPTGWWVADCPRINFSNFAVEVEGRVLEPACAGWSLHIVSDPIQGYINERRVVMSNLSVSPSSRLRGCPRRKSGCVCFPQP